jgi:hypothetical protein
MNTSLVDTRPKPFVFVLMPFHKKFDDAYELGIVAACSEAGAHCERVDKQYFRGKILDRIFHQIATADVLVAEMTGKNANVFYEVGYAHALGKEVILLTKIPKDIPFDLKDFPHIIYENISSLKAELSQRVSWAIKNPHRTSTLRPAALDGPLGPYSGFVREIELTGTAHETLVKALASELKTEKLQFHTSEDLSCTECPGFLSRCFKEHTGWKYTANIHVDMVMEVFPALAPILTKHATQPFTLKVRWIPGVAQSDLGVGWTARARNTEFRVESYRLRFRKHFVYFREREELALSGDALPTISEISDLISLLFDSRMVDFDPSRSRNHLNSRYASLADLVPSQYQ